MAELIVKKNVKNQRLHVSICDDYLIGKRLQEGNKCLNLSADFYNGIKSSEEEIKTLLNKCVSASFVGEESLKLGKNVFGNLDVKSVEKIPFSNVFRI
ncbi:MAG: DUF424 family protein [Nanobdellota archaeon]